MKPLHHVHSKPIRTLKEIDVLSRQVFLRLDLNVPLSSSNEITDDTRITEAIPTIEYLLQNRAKLIIGSHLGRPKGQRKPEFSLEPVGAHLAKLLNKEVTLAQDCIGEGIELMARCLQPGQILLLENLRFHPEEEKNDPLFAQALSRLCDVYITDAFGTCHREHASTYGLPEVMAEKGMGFLIEKELKYLNPLVHSPKKPLVVILGGAKVSDKIQAISSLMKHMDTLLIGGAMAFAFEKAQGKQIPPAAKQPSAEDVECAQRILRETRKKDLPVFLPKDTLDGFDIGPETVALFKEKLAPAATVFWNGPLGWFEKPDYAKGTFKIAEFLANHSSIRIVGGGDTVSAIKQSRTAEKFDHLSTGGGAVLEYLAHRKLPGIEILRTAPGAPRPL